MSPRIGSVLLVIGFVCTATATAAAWPSLFPEPFSGYVEAKEFTYFGEAGPSDPPATLWGTFFLKQEGGSRKTRFVVSLRAEAIGSREREELAFDPADRDLRRSPLSIREVYVRTRLADSLDLQAGRFELGWGKTDGYSPADTFLPRDLSDPFSDEKLPVWGARLSGQTGAIRFELLGTVTTTPWRLPVLEGRFAPLPVSGVILEDGESHAPKTGFAAVRLLGNWGEWDAGVWARSGMRPAPLLVFRIDEVHPTPNGFAIPVDRRFVRESAAGFELSRVVGSWVVRTEAAALSSPDPELRSALIGAIGVEHAMGDGTFVATVAANARGTAIPAALLFDRSILPAFIAAWTQTESWGSWKLASTTALRHGDGLLKAEIVDHVTDEWTVATGGDLPYGPRSGPIGALREARRIWIGVRRSW